MPPVSSGPGRIIGADDPAWREALARLDHDVYHTPEWHAAFEGLEGRKAAAYLAEVDGHILLHPFHTRPIDGGGFDVEGAYGYAGPIASSDDPEFLARAWSGYHVWAQDNAVPSEFVRFNPMLGNVRFASTDMAVVLDRQTVWIDLSEGPEALWTGYESRQRWSVRRAEKNGLACEQRPFTEDPLGFASFYRAAMAEIGAAESYFFPDEHFMRLAELFGDRIREFQVLHNGELFSSAMVIGYGERLHYHLAATPRSTRNAYPGNLLLHRAALWGLEQGYRIFHLGGGRTSDPADDLLSFKRQFSKRRAEFHIGKRVLDQCAFDRLCGAWSARNPGPRPPYFQLYRLPERN